MKTRTIIGRREIAQILARRKQDLKERLKYLNRLDSVSTLPITDDVEIASSSAEDEMRAIALEGCVEEMAEIDSALERLREGSYGTCQNCGKPIPLSRLKALPFADLCVSCKERFERQREEAEDSSLLWEIADEYRAG